MSTAPEGVAGELATRGGVVRATLYPGEGVNRIERVEFSGTFERQSEEILLRLGEVLEGATIDQAPARIENFFTQNPGTVQGVQPGEFLTALSLAFMKVRRTVSSAPDPNEWKKDLE